MSRRKPTNSLRQCHFTGWGLCFANGWLIPSMEILLSIPGKNHVPSASQGGQAKSNSVLNSPVDFCSIVELNLVESAASAGLARSSIGTFYFAPIGTSHLRRHFRTGSEGIQGRCYNQSTFRTHIVFTCLIEAARM